MITLDMINKTSELRITEKMFTLENNILTLELDPGEYDLTNKVITAKFSATEIETVPLTVTAEGIIQLPIYSNLIKYGLNYIQLNFRWDVDKLEQSGKMLWKIDNSIATTAIAQEDIDIVSYLISEVNRVVGETGDIKEALDLSITNAGTSKTNLLSTIDTANTTKGTLEGTIGVANTSNGALETTIQNAGTSKTNLEGTIGVAGTAQTNLNAKIGEATTAKTVLDQAIVNNQIVTLPVFNAHKIDYTTQIGTVANLTTTSKVVVGAVNELNTNKANKVQGAWITPTLLNGWVYFQGTLGYMKDTLGFVHLSGTIQSGINNQYIFNLPVGYRPQSAMQRFPVVPNNTTTCIVDINPTGVVIRGTTAPTWVSLDSVSFKAEV